MSPENCDGCEYPHPIPRHLMLIVRVPVDAEPVETLGLGYIEPSTFRLCPNCQLALIGWIRDSKRAALERVTGLRPLDGKGGE